MTLKTNDLIGREFHDTDKRRYGIIVGFKFDLPIMQLHSGRRFLIFPEALKRGWIETEREPAKIDGSGYAGDL